MVNLSALSLLRNDPDVAAEMLAAAQQGDVDAQYGMGLIYAEGRGVALDEVRAYYWLSRAIAQGDRGAKTLLRVVASAMSREQVRQARQLLDARPAERQSRAGRKPRSRRRGLH